MLLQNMSPGPGRWRCVRGPLFRAGNSRTPFCEILDFTLYVSALAGRVWFTALLITWSSSSGSGLYGSPAWSRAKSSISCQCERSVAVIDRKLRSCVMRDASSPVLIGSNVEHARREPVTWGGREGRAGVSI